MRVKVEHIDSISFSSGKQLLHLYGASAELPRKVTLTEIMLVVRELEDALRVGRPDMVIHERPITLEAKGAPYAGAVGILLSVQGSSMVPPCSHLADSDEPGGTLSTEPCGLCGRYFVDD